MRNLEKFFLTSLLAGGCLAPPTEVVGARMPAVETSAPEPTAPSPEFLEEIRELKMEGDDVAVRQTRSALRLLREKATLQYNEARKYLSWAVIKLPSEKDSPADSHASFGSPILVVLTAQARSAGDVWLGGVVTHEGCHVRQYYSGKEPWDPTPERPLVAPKRTGNEEKECGAVQYDTLKLLGASQAVLDYVKTGYGLD